jgi:transcriptional regulator with XRE-family HTH domain
MKEDQCMTRKMMEKRKQLEEAGDHQGVKRLEFGRFICTLRLLVSDKYSQTQAAKIAGITRTEWNRIENGHVMPHATNIPGIADALKIDEVELFKRAGLAVPAASSIYDKRKAYRDLKIALDESRSLTDFLIDMQGVWQLYQFAQTGLQQRIIFEPNFATAIAFVTAHLTKAQRLQLAFSIVREAGWQDVESAGIENQQFFDEIDTLLDKLRKNKREDEEEA